VRTETAKNIFDGWFKRKEKNSLGFGMALAVGRASSSSPFLETSHRYEWRTFESYPHKTFPATV
jgi:hypothetical protein